MVVVVVERLRRLQEERLVRRCGNLSLEEAEMTNCFAKPTNSWSKEAQILKVLSIVRLHSKYTRALTCENFWQNVNQPILSPSCPFSTQAQEQEQEQEAARKHTHTHRLGIRSRSAKRN